MPIRSSCARGASLARYTMCAFELVEKLLNIAAFSTIGLPHPLANALGGVGFGRDVEQSLIRSRILYDYRGLAFDGQYTRPLLFLSCFMKSPDRRRKVV